MQGTIPTTKGVTPTDLADFPTRIVALPSIPLRTESTRLAQKGRPPLKATPTASRKAMPSKRIISTRTPTLKQTWTLHRNKFPLGR
mmetsp:Transcript_37684/g.61080  ORF Transcript_37684/g.61080 Transcript_37684/m.61080 type:complete len:86 (-) Transcript_37684:84-341(-)